MLPAPALPGSGSTVGGSQRALSARFTGLPCKVTIPRPEIFSTSGSVRRHDAAAVRERFEQARLYLCTDARERQGDLEDFLDAVLAAGVDVVQLREKGLEARDEMRFLEVFAAAAQRHGKLFAVNDRADVARAAQAPILHLGQDDLPVPWLARSSATTSIIGRSTHSPAQFDAADVEPGR